MANNKNELDSMNWGEIFGFTRVFKSFRLAINISALGLGLAALILVWLTGAVMDRAAFIVNSEGVIPGEISQFNRLDGEGFANAKERWEKGRPAAVANLQSRIGEEKFSRAIYIRALRKCDIESKQYADAFVAIVDEQKTKGSKDYKAPDTTALKKAAEEDWSGELSKAKSDAGAYFNGLEEIIDKASDKAEDEIGGLPPEDRDKAEGDLKEYEIFAKKELTKAKTDFVQTVESIKGQDISVSFVTYESQMLKDAAMALLGGNIAGGLNEYLDQTPLRPGTEEGFIVKMLSVARGVQWLFAEHWLYATIFMLISLAIWALFGGAIHRIVAVQAARDERISLSQALRFSRERFLSFFLAPLMPIVIIVILGAVLMVGGLLFNLGSVGAAAAGLLFIVALLIGLAIAFGLIGLIGGAGLMFPTIAVEGSDSFDAISRSYTYLFGRPWRAGLYAAAAMVHGTICYMFLRVFVYLALKATHLFAGAIVWKGGDALPGVANANRLDTLWAEPTFANLHDWNYQAISNWETTGAFLISIWVHLIIALLAAFVLTYLAGATTSIYYMLRRKVDATDYDEVYIEDEEEQFDFGAAAEPAPVVEAAEAASDKNKAEESEEPADEAGDDAKADDAPEQDSEQTDDEEDKTEE